MMSTHNFPLIQLICHKEILDDISNTNYESLMIWPLQGKDREIDKIKSVEYNRIIKSYQSWIRMNRQQQNENRTKKKKRWRCSRKKKKNNVNFVYIWQRQTKTIDIFIQMIFGNKYGNINDILRDDWWMNCYDWKNQTGYECIKAFDINDKYTWSIYSNVSWTKYSWKKNKNEINK